jgi:tetratricopeptide (TPR) repeat protein
MLKKRIALFLFFSLPLYGIAQKHASRGMNEQALNRDSIEAKIRWYETRKDTPNIIKYQVLKIDRSGLDTAGLGRAFTNNMIYELFFMYSQDLKVLNKSISWIKQIVDSDKPISAGHIDTYANLLYKVGRKKEAIEWQEKAVALSPEIPELLDNLNKMKSNQPTWK